MVQLMRNYLCTAAEPFVSYRPRGPDTHNLSDEPEHLIFRRDVARTSRRFSSKPAVPTSALTLGGDVGPVFTSSLD